MQVHPKLAHLSPEQMRDLLKKYDDPSIPLKEIISEFSIQTSPGALNGILPPLIHKDSACPYCTDFSLQSRRPSRHGYVSHVGRCPNCGHRDADSCHCEKCRDTAAMERRSTDETKRGVVRKDYEFRCWDKELEDLTLRDAVYISALVRQSLSEDLVRVDPYASGPPKLAPTGDLMREIIKRLQGQALLAVDPESPVDAFVFNDELTQAHSYYPAKVDWLFLPRIDACDKQKFLLDLNDAVDGDWPGAWQSDMPKLWREIIKAEAFEYFHHMLAQRGYQFDKIGEKTHAAFDFLVERFSLSKINNLVWQAVRDVTDYNVKNDVPTYRARNNFIGAIQRKAEKYIAQGWELRDSRRDFDCPQTWISSTFFDSFLKVGDKAFTSMPPAVSE